MSNQSYCLKHSALFSLTRVFNKKALSPVLFFLMFNFSVTALAQSGEIKGVVTDE
jgi:hypothetical protein